MNLVIDIGNTQIKVAVFKNSLLLEHHSFKIENILIRLEELGKKYRIQRAIVSHVTKISIEVVEKIKQNFDVLILDNNTNLPFTNHYLTPKTLGVDRLALVAQASKEHPGTNVLVIDAGSCITYDFLNEHNAYHGGSISPGIEMRYKAVNHYTANLPLLEREDAIPEVGDSTKNAIHRGILNGVIQEIEGVISQYTKEKQKLTVVLTGGDTIFLAKNLKSSIFANPIFLLEGLNTILIHNKDE